MTLDDVIAYETRVADGELAYVHARAGEDRLPLVALIHELSKRKKFRQIFIQRGAMSIRLEQQNSL